jgi:TRAP-type C4-dicarboxylate transport system permease small subunit
VLRAAAAKVLFACAALLLGGMCAALLLQIVAREFTIGADWTEELSRFAFISMVFLAAAYATLTRRHLEVTVFSDLIAMRIGRAKVAAFHCAVLLAFDAAMAWYSALNFVDGLRWPNISPALGAFARPSMARC